MIFYISSQGHAATKWISDAFSLHKDVVSFHGIRSMPPVTIFEEYDHFGVPLHKLSGYSKETADNLARGLYQCASHSGRVFGASHTVWGLLCKEPFERLGGQFGGIIRHPIMQFHSIMNAFCARALSYEELPIDYEINYNYMDVMCLDIKRFTDFVGAKKVKFLQASYTEKKYKILSKALKIIDKKLSLIHI